MVLHQLRTQARTGDQALHLVLRIQGSDRVITVFVMAFALIWVAALLGCEPRTCSECDQPLPRRHIVRHYQDHHAPPVRSRS